VVRPRWPDVLVVLGIVGLTALGAAALWGDRLRAWWDADAPAPEQAPAHGGGVT
jgi:hypothetical protein